MLGLVTKASQVSGGPGGRISCGPSRGFHGPVILSEYSIVINPASGGSLAPIVTLLRPTAASLKDTLVRIGLQASEMPFAADDAARVEYVTAAGERMQLTRWSHVAQVLLCAVEYRVVLSAAASHDAGTRAGADEVVELSL